MTKTNETRDSLWAEVLQSGRFSATTVAYWREWAATFDHLDFDNAAEAIDWIKWIEDLVGYHLTSS